MKVEARFKATAEIELPHLICACPFTASAQSYQHIHPTIQLHHSHSYQVLNRTSDWRILDQPVHILFDQRNY